MSTAFKFKTLTKSSKEKVKKKTPAKSTTKRTKGLSTYVSERYEGRIEGIIGSLKTLPQTIQDLINNSVVLKVQARHDFSLYKLENGLVIKIHHVRRDNKPKLHLVIKEKRKELLNTII